MSIREWWRSFTHYEARSVEGERLTRTREETTLRTQVRLEAEADAKANTAKSMKELGLVEAAEELRKDVEELRSRVEKLEKRDGEAYLSDGADAFGGRR